MNEVPDRVLVTEGSRVREMTVAEYLRLPLDRQLELLMLGHVKFFRGGTALRTIDALKVLRERKAA
ncbi:MAG: hypothetical protein JNK82_37730 [Myxococcaceae bacterium]|nr:hypothetical protein [Myxococcaceae bacterium]